MKARKYLKRILLVSIVLLILICSLKGVYTKFFDPYRGTVTTLAKSEYIDTLLSKKEAVEDLSYMIKMLKDRHPACMNGLPEEISAQYKEETESLPEEVNILQLWQASARIFAKMNDAHTGIIYENSEPGFSMLQFSMKNKKLYYISDGYDNAVITKVNGLPLEQLYHAFLVQHSYELESTAAFQFSNYFRRESFLKFLGVDTSSKVTLSMVTDQGERQEVMTFPLRSSSHTPHPEPVFYHLDNENSLGVLIINACYYDDHYCNTVKEFFTKVKENSIKHIAVDLRYNSGGNSMVINEFLQYIDIENYSISGNIKARFGPFLYRVKKHVINNKRNMDLLFAGDIYALTSPNTFSSAEMFAVTLQDNKIGQIIGEIPGNMPSHYGDILTFQAPNSKLGFTISYKYFGRIDESKEEQPLIPDYEVAAEEAKDILYDIISKDRN